MQYGYKLSAEGFGPNELVRQAKLAEASGFDFVEISDHYHPWLESQGHSPFAWTVLGSIAASTETVGLATGVTCPTVRYHPAIIAQAAATLSLVSDGRFTLGVGSGERLNEHVVGRGFPAVADRQAMLREALEIIRLLWQGGYQSYRGEYLDLEDARVFDLPDELPVIAVAAGGPDAAELAAELGDGMFGTEPKPELFDAYRGAGGRGPTYGEVGLAWAESEEAAVQAAFETSRWALTGWKVMSELPNPANFEAASQVVKPEDVAASMPCGPDVTKHLEAIREYEQVGYDHVVLTNNGPDPDGFMDFFARELKPALGG
ncbi:G6PDH family F420-dependent oxidoreductase [Agromyces sp. 3263]|uniref:TIGR03557 family F420-dependent LLM class oxidoreductase n=1 Tax=Agromyces sp. 3263 TaxID=2817750 RepID=UPI00285437B4|nr:TIGR03557 family F420-dependent LLM class oxidoreductase [Agromyces sp. 3263]MDR6905268.1 G6PDH family F420-dependent oxidoreductase [Agromyces sp. 3263]